jgi:streptogramin lyase
MEGLEAVRASADVPGLRDERDKVWLTEWSTNSAMRFDRDRVFEQFQATGQRARAQMLAGRRSVGAESAPIGWY